MQGEFLLTFGLGPLVPSPNAGLNVLHAYGVPSSSAARYLIARGQARESACLAVTLRATAFRFWKGWTASGRIMALTRQFLRATGVSSMFSKQEVHYVSIH